MSGIDKFGDKLRINGFKPGQSGNPSGRKKGAERRFRDVVAARTYMAKDGITHTGLDALANVLLDIAFDAEEKSVDRIAAACKYVDRGWGSVKQSVEITGDRAPKGAATFDPAKMSDADIREGLAAIGALKRLGAVEDDDAPTEH